MLEASVLAQLQKAVRDNRSRSQQGTKVSVDNVFSSPTEIADIAARIADGVVVEPAGQNHTWSVVEPSAPLPTYATTIAHFRFDDASGTAVADASRNDNDLVVSGASWVTGKFGSGLDFDGNNDVATVTAVSAEPLRNYIYVSCWIKPSSVTGTRPIVKLADRFTLYLDAGVLKCALVDGGTTYTVDSGKTAVTGSWQFVTLQFIDGMVLLALGDLVHRETIACVRFAEEFPAAGKVLTVGSDGTNYFAGTVDELVVEAGVRVQDDFPKVSVVAGQNDVIYWPFLENAGTEVHSSKVLGETLTLHGGTWTTGRTLYGVSFDGVNDYAECTPKAVSFDDVVSVEVGIKLLADEETPILTQAGGINLKYDGAGGIVAALGGVSNPTTVVGQLTYSNSFVSVVIVYDGTNKECWVNGQKVGEVACTGTAVMPAAPLYVGKDGTDFGNIVVDRVRVYKARLKPYYRYVPYYLPTVHGFTSTEKEWLTKP